MENGQIEKKVKPVEKKAAPAEKKAVPAEKKAAPAEKKAAPAEKKAAPAEKKAVPAEKKAAPAEKKAAPAEKKAAPAEKKAVPAEKKAAPAEKKAVPAEKKAVSAEKKAVPAEKKDAPAEQKNAPVKKKMSKKKREALRRKKMRRRMIRLGFIGAVAVAALVLILMFFNAYVHIAGSFYPTTTQKIDLRSSGVNDVKGIARLTKLEEALLGGNAVSDVTALESLTECKYIDLTGCPVTAESYAYLRNALPECLILCEAEDYTTTHMALGGHTLPGIDALMRVFESHQALKEVDLRGSSISQADADMLCKEFAHINFIYSADGDADTMVLRFSNAQDAAAALQRVSDAAHVTLTGCAFTAEEYRTLTEQFPNMTVDCLISLYGKTYPLSAEQIDLSGCTTDEALVENLKLFEKLSMLTVSEAAPSEIARIKEELSLEVNYTYNGIEIDSELTQIDLRGAENLTASELESLIDMLPGLTAVSMDAPDASLIEVVKAHKQIRFGYEVSAFGQVFAGDTTAIDLKDAVTDKNVDELIALIEKLPNLKKADMYESKLSKENMDKLFDGYPEVYFGWTFTMCDGKYVVRTDATAFSTQIGLPMNFYTEKHLEQLRYCKNLLALDLGHNNISNIDFLYYFPKLKVLILADNKFSDITPIASLTELEYLELFMNNAVRDFTPLLELPLEHLNICFCGDKENQITADLFMGMTTLKRFWASRSYFDKKEGQRLAKALPKCTVSVTYGESTGDGWRRGEPYQTLERMFETGVYEELP